ncbi:MAG TPA: hypothetical protein VFS10_13340 [Pyrinomonadaceae bacterium]|nr:hypothetical protein [Pyrinomonadaceae bacterium]
MSSDRFEANCKRCDRTFEYGLFSRSYPYCVECKAELDEESLRQIGAGKVSWVEDWPDPTAPRAEGEVERQERYTSEDHRRSMDDYDRRNKS